MTDTLLGLSEAVALAQLGEQGLFPQVMLTAPPRGAAQDGQRRVVRVSPDGSRIWVAVFEHPKASCPQKGDT